MNEIQALAFDKTITDIYYLVSILFLLFLPIGTIISIYGLSRPRHSTSTIVMLFMSLPVIILSTYLFGWAFHFTFSSGPGITGNFQNISHAVPWSELMAPNLKSSTLNLVIFFIFSWSIVVILGAAAIERIKFGAFIILSILLGSVFWPIASAWSWTIKSWMVEIFGYHDAYGAGAIHAVLGGFTLGVLTQLKHRVIKFTNQQQSRSIVPSNPLMLLLGRIFMTLGLIGILLAANFPILEIKNAEGIFFETTNIYGAPISLSGSLYNFMLALSGGLLMSYIISKGDLYWMFSGGIIGIVSISAGCDYYFPLQSFLISLVITFIVYKSYHWLEEKFKFDDAIGAISIHGFAGFWGLLIAGIVLWGYPSSTNPEFVSINPFGQFAGAIILFWILGFVPGYLTAKILNFFNLLRISETTEIAGKDVMSLRNHYFQEKDIQNAEKAIVKAQITNENE